MEYAEFYLLRTSDGWKIATSSNYGYGEDYNFDDNNSDSVADESKAESEIVRTAMLKNPTARGQTALSDTILKIKGLNKTLGKKQILHSIDMECYGGEVCGFLGPNGAGKTTTIKIAVGLLQLDEGEISINGKDIKKDFEGAMANVGGIVENPEMYKYLSGMENLRQYARMREGVTEERIKEVVELVRLSNRINDKVSKYSLGMRQRLGVAQAILHRPKLLILDEPTNGLDPQGIKELRDILKELAHKEGTCVVVSSHLMSEMEMMCDRVGIIANGKMIGSYTMEELISQSDSSIAEYQPCLKLTTRKRLWVL